MRLLILGGTRFGGHAAAGAVLGRGWEVTTFNRGSPALIWLASGRSAVHAITTRVVHSAPEAGQVLHEEDHDGRFPDESPV